MMDQAGQRLLPLDGHGQGRDGQFRPHVATHRPADDFAGEEIEHDGQIEPPFFGWHVGDVGEPNLIGPLGGEFLVEPVWGDRQIVMAVGGAYPKPPWRYRSDALMTHEAFDAATAHHIPPGAQGRVNPGRAITAAMCHMDPPDLGQQSAIDCLAQTFRPATPGIIPRRRDTHHIAHDANRRTGNVSRWSAMRRNFISALPRKCAAFFLESPAPCADVRSRAADGRFQRPNPHRHAGSPPAYWSAAAIPHAPRYSCSARRAASKGQSPASAQSGSTAGRCSLLPKELIIPTALN